MARILQLARRSWLSTIVERLGTRFQLQRDRIKSAAYTTCRSVIVVQTEGRQSGRPGAAGAQRRSDTADVYLAGLQSSIRLRLSGDRAKDWVRTPGSSAILLAPSPEDIVSQNWQGKRRSRVWTHGYVCSGGPIMPTNTSPWPFYGALLLITLGALAQCLGSPIGFPETDDGPAYQALRNAERNQEACRKPSAGAITFDCSDVEALPLNQHENASDVAPSDRDTRLVPEPATALVSIIGVLYLWSRKQRIG